MALAFTAREMKHLTWAFQAMETVPKINYAKMAELAGMSNQNSAANAWREIRKKIDAADENAEATTDVTTAKTIKAAGRKRKAKDADGDDDTETEFTPKKKRGRKPAVKKEAEEAEENGDVEAEKKTLASKKHARKPAAPKEAVSKHETLVADEEVEGSDLKMEESESTAGGDFFVNVEEV